MKGNMSDCLRLILLLLHQISVYTPERFEVVGPSEPTVAVAGEDIVLPCYLNPSISAEDMRVEWFRVPSTGSVYLYQEREIRNEDQIPSYRGRTALSPEELKRGDASLRLTGVRASDEGRYKCFIDSTLWSDDASVQVQIKGTEPVISMEVPHRAGWVSLLCESKGWDIQPDLLWLDSEGHSLPAAATETHRDSEDLYTVRRHVFIQDRDTNTVTCRVHLQDRKLEKDTEFDITAEMVPVTRWKASLAVFLSLAAAALIGCAVLTHRNKTLRREKVEEIKTALRSGTLWDKQLEPDQCSTLAYVLLTGDILDEFDIKKYKTSAADRQRLVRAVRNCRKALLDSSDLTKESCEIVASALQSPNSPLRELDLSFNNLGDSGVKLLCAGLMSPNCKLQTLGLVSVNLTGESCEIVASVLQSPNSPLRELDLSFNNLGYSRVKLLCAGLMSPNCKLQRLGLDSVNLTEESCGIVASALQSSNSPLRELDLSFNNLGVSGVRLFCVGLKSPNCKLQRLGLVSVNLTGEYCGIVASVLQSPSSPLGELDLSFNNLGDSGVKLLCAGLKSPNCKLQTLGLGWCNLTEGCCDNLASILRSPHSELRDLELRDNDLQDSGVRALSAGLEDPHCTLQRLGLSGCQVTERGCDSLASALCSNHSHLRQLDLSYNHPGDSGERALSTAKLDTLTLLVDHGGESRNKPGPRKYGCQLTLDPNTAHSVLSLSEGDRKVTWGSWQSYPDHPDRFDWWYQVMCRESLSERCYWEAEWSVPEGGLVYIAVTHKGISRNGWGDECGFGKNRNSWILWCTQHGHSVWHNNKETAIPAPPSPYRRAGESQLDTGVCVYRVGVCVDRPAGILSFYSVSDSDTLTLLHTYHTSFTRDQPLCAGFSLYGENASVSLCQLE